MPEQFLTAKQVAERLAVTEKKVRELCQRGSKHGGLDGIKIDSQWRISEDELKMFIEAKKRQ